MPFKNLSAMREFGNRRSKRMAEQGRLLELEVCDILTRMKNSGNIIDFTYHETHSEQDREGRDFTVTAERQGQILECSFGVTISHRSWRDARRRYPKVPQLCFLLNIKRRTMEERILELLAMDSTE